MGVENGATVSGRVACSSSTSTLCSFTAYKGFGKVGYNACNKTKDFQFGGI